MPVHREKKIVPYTAEQIFDLVADIERYPEFLPWCIATRRIRQDDGGGVYELAVGFRLVREKFISKVRFERPGKIHTEYIRGPLRYLHSDWCRRKSRSENWYRRGGLSLVRGRRR